MKKIALFGCALLTFSLFATTFEEVWKEGISKIRNKQPEEALVLFKQAAELAKNNAQKTDALLQISLAMPADQGEEALRILLEHRANCKNLPKQNEAWLELRIGVLQTQLKQYNDAIKTLSYALNLKKLGDRDRILAYDMLSQSQVNTRQLDAALQSLEAWEAIDALSSNDYARLLTRRAGILGAKKRFEEAYQAGEEAVALESVTAKNRAMAYQMLAWIAFGEEHNPTKAKMYSEKSKAVPYGKVGFNESLHKQILKACGE